MSRIPQFSVSWEEFIDNLIEENKKLKEDFDLVYIEWKILNNDLCVLRMENKKLKEENELLKQCLDKLMFNADVVNVKIHWELWDYVYVRSDKQFKLNVKD